MLNGYTRNGKRIIGTYDLVPATALLIGRSEEGDLIFDGESVVCWDASETQKERGQIIFIDEDHEYILEADVEWRNEERIR